MRRRSIAMTALVARARRFGRGRDVALWYAAVVIGIVVGLAFLPPADRTSLVLHSSTNLDNLRHHPVSVLVASAFVLGSPWELVEIPLLIWLYGALQRWLGRGPTLVIGTFGHVGATLFVAVMLVAGITRGEVSPAVSHVDDVGVSYGLAAVAGVCILRVPRRWLPGYAAALVFVLVAALAFSPTFTDIGHLTAWTIGLAIAVVVAAAGEQSPALSPAATQSAVVSPPAVSPPAVSPAAPPPAVSPVVPSPVVSSPMMSPPIGAEESA